MATKPQQAPRPRQVTLAASLVMAASLLLVLSVFERLGSLRSLENRASVQRFLSEPPGSELGMGLESALQVLRTVSMVAAGLATAAAILGYHVLKRSRPARIGLSVLALPLFLCGLVTGGFLASVVAASAAMLWLAPARQWFSGTGPPASGAAARTAGARQVPPTGLPPAGSPFQPPAQPPAQPPVQPPVQQPVPPPGADQPPPWPAYAAGPPWPPHAYALQAPVRVPRPPRPKSVVVACVVTWVCCAFAVLMAMLLIGVLAADADGLFAEMHRQNPSLADQGVSDATLRSAVWATAIVFLVWGVVAGVLAVLAFNRTRWAAIGLVVSAGLVAVVCLAVSLASPVLVLPGVLAAVTGGLLLQSGVQRWYARRSEHPRPRHGEMAP